VLLSCDLFVATQPGTTSEEKLHGVPVPVLAVSNYHTLAQLRILPMSFFFVMSSYEAKS